MPFYEHRVKEFMRRELVTFRATTPIDLLTDRMHAHDSTLLLVVDADGYALGTISHNMSDVELQLVQQAPTRGTTQSNRQYQS